MNENIRMHKKGIIVASLIILKMLLALGARAQKSDSVSIENKMHSLEQVIVTGTRTEVDIRKLPLTVSIISNQTINNRYQQSALPVLNEQVPGLFITSRGNMGYGVAKGASGTMSIRGIGGSPTTGVQVLIDGLPQNMGLMGHPIADLYQSMLAERIEVVRGPASVLYGSNAMGGVINVVTPKLKKDSIITKIKLGYGSFNSLEAGLLNRYQKKRFSAKTYIAYNQSDGHRENLDFDQISAYAKLGYSIGKQWNIYTDVNITNFNASNPGTTQAPINDNDSHITRGMTALSLENKSNRSSGAFKLFYNWGRHEIDDGFLTGETPKEYHFNSRDVMAGTSIFQSFSLFSNNHITIGADYFHFGGNAWNQFSDHQWVIADTTENEIAGYIDVRQSISDFITLDAGIRYDYHTKSGKQWIPQGGISIHLPNALEVKAMVSKGFRNPTLKDLYLFGSQNPDLLPESIMNYELSVNHSLLPGQLKYSLNLFYLKGNNMIQTIFTNGRPLNVNTGKVENYGIEATANYQINSTWHTSANYSWLNMKYPVIAAPKHKLYTDINYTKNKFIISTGIQYINHLYVSTDPIEFENYILWNARATYHVNHSLKVFVRGENLLNQEYEINKGYPMPGASFSIGTNYQF